MQSLAVAYRQLKRAVIGWEDQNVAGGIQNRRADLAMLQVPLNLHAQFWRDAVVNVVGDVCPNVFAVQFHGILPQNPLRAGAVVFKSGAKLFCSIIRARCSLTFAMFSLMSKAAAVSATLNSSTSPNVKICR